MERSSDIQLYVNEKAPNHKNAKVHNGILTY